ncbi:GntR family transcriptional regulator [Geminisphaera colitermitum]|uniref:GntR family transcriptional regulator n=1 Tax=Geminisphaera colitermitum TaxID=1148786 RepID=UPI00019655FB|nr:GntR family transcriptional regulator [Geminisphaera colitermitum]
MPDPIGSASSASPFSADIDAVARKAICDQVVVERVESPTFQISARVRQMIRDARLQPGMKLPTNRALAGELGVDPSAVQRALAQLVKEGLLIRTRRVGTFVAEPPKSIKRLAYYHRATPDAALPGFARAIVTEITRIGHARGFAVDVFIDTRKPAVSAIEPYAELQRHARARLVQGVIMSSVSPETVTWVPGLPVPYALISKPGLAHSINWRREQFVDTALRQLAARGCRKIGVISSLVMREDPEGDDYQLGFYRTARTTLADLGLRHNPDWLAGVPRAKDNGRIGDDIEHAALGFELFNRVWSQPEKPDGLFLYPDFLASGALIAAARHGCRIGQDLHLVVHRNAEVPLFWPDPVDWLVVRASDAATALVSHIRDQLAGRTTANHTLHAHIEAHE